MKLTQGKLVLLVLTVVLIAELGLIGTLAGLRAEIPEQAWSLVYATVGILAGAAGAQQWNGRIARKEREEWLTKSQTPER